MGRIPTAGGEAFLTRRRSRRCEDYDRDLNHLADLQALKPMTEHGRQLRNFSELRRIGWGARIRTWECRYQKPMPYHLATPQPVPPRVAEGRFIATWTDRCNVRLRFDCRWRPPRPGHTLLLPAARPSHDRRSRGREPGNESRCTQVFLLRCVPRKKPL